LENKYSPLEAGITEAGYRGVFKIKDIELKLEPQETLVITGRSGSGKTTLLKTLLGIIEESPNGYWVGDIRLYGRSIRDYKPWEIYNLVSYIPQEPWYAILGHIVYVEYCHALSVAGKTCSIKNLERYGLGESVNHITYGLSAGQYQRLLWSIALDKDSKIMFMDEPLVYIDQSGRDSLRRLIEEYIDSGGSVVIVDHMPESWSFLEPKLLVLEDGLVKYYGVYDEEKIPKPPRRREELSGRSMAGKVLLEAENIWYRYPGENWVLRGVSLNLHGGEILGIIGGNGAGKTTLLKILAGIYTPGRGFVRVYGRRIYVPENPLLYFTHPTPREEIYGFDRLGLADRIVGEFRLGNILDKPLALLSSGERRRVALASAFVSGYNIYLLDEPSGGLDYYSLEEIINILKYLRSRGYGVVVTTHDDRLYSIIDKKCLLRNGVLRCE
jgi:ABC-type multidrug transport system ATPase subunit